MVYLTTSVPTKSADGVTTTLSPSRLARPAPVSMFADSTVRGVSGKGLKSFASTGTVTVLP